MKIDIWFFGEVLPPSILVTNVNALIRSYLTVCKASDRRQ
ncbi:hypothetical protein OROMI_003268 [Orobanche minor]